MNVFINAEKNDVKELTIKEYYSAIVELSAQFLGKHDYKRSGKTEVFYKYNSDKSKGYLIGFRKKLDNTPDFCAFSILFGSVSIDDFCRLDSCRDRINLKDLKTMLMNGYSTSSYSHILDDFVLKNENSKDYFQFNILLRRTS